MLVRGSPRSIGRTAVSLLRWSRGPSPILRSPQPCGKAVLHLSARDSSKDSHHATATSFTALNDTIYALSTAQGRAGIAVIRISGPSCLQIYQALCPNKSPLKPRCAALRTLHSPVPPGPDAGSPNVLDSGALLLYFPGPRSVTGEDVLELHVHGGSATVKAVLAAIPRCRTKTRARYAEPGEFTKRAFLHDRLDLAQVESLSDTLDAETEQQRRAAVCGVAGHLGSTYEDWRQQLLLARGEIEALIDFSEDQHFDESQEDLLESVSRQVARIMERLDLHQLGGRRSDLLRRGIRIALVGPPNAGKSSLMNIIAGREASIVSGEAGTTRDVVEARLDLGGYLCSFADTAGFRTHGHDIGHVEREGIRRARQTAQDADIVLVLASVESGPSGPSISFDAETLALAAGAPAALIVVNKRDIVRNSGLLNSLLECFHRRVEQDFPALALTAKQNLCVSCLDGDGSDHGGSQVTSGIQEVVEALVASFSSMTDMPSDLQHLLGVTERQMQLMAKCRRHLQDFMHEARGQETTGQDQNGNGRDADIVLAAEYLRFAADCLSRITGRGEAGDVEDVLGVVFEKFCVGK